MKNLHYCVFLLTMLFLSCQQEEIIYSCDPEINDFIRLNISEIQAMSRAEFLKAERDLRPAIFNALTAERRQQIWLEKYEDALKLKWSKKESEHIKLLIQFVSGNRKYFEEPQKFEDEISIFAYKWMRYAENVLLWDNNTIYNMIYDPGTLARNSQNELVIVEDNTSLKETDDITYITKKLKTRDENTPPPTVKCTCNESANDCGTTGLMVCRKWNCIAIIGCGSFGLKVCDGGCYRKDL